MKTIFLTSFVLGCTASLIVEDQLLLPPSVKEDQFLQQLLGLIKPVLFHAAKIVIN